MVIRCPNAVRCNASYGDAQWNRSLARAASGGEDGGHVISLHVPQQWRSSLLHKQTRPRRECGNSMFSNRTPGVPSFSSWLPPPPWLSPDSPHCPPLISRLVSCVWSLLFQKNNERPIFLMVLWAFLLSRALNSQSHFVSRLLRVLRWNDASPLMRSSECSTVSAHRPTRKSDSLSESVLLNRSFQRIVY